MPEKIHTVEMTRDIAPDPAAEAMAPNPDVRCFKPVPDSEMYQINGEFVTREEALKRVETMRQEGRAMSEEQNEIHLEVSIDGADKDAVLSLVDILGTINSDIIDYQCPLEPPDLSGPVRIDSGIRSAAPGTIHITAIVGQLDRKLTISAVFRSSGFRQDDLLRDRKGNITRYDPYKAIPLAHLGKFVAQSPRPIPSPV